MNSSMSKRFPEAEVAGVLAAAIDASQEDAEIAVVTVEAVSGAKAYNEQMTNCYKLSTVPNDEVCILGRKSYQHNTEMIFRYADIRTTTAWTSSVRMTVSLDMTGQLVVSTRK